MLSLTLFCANGALILDLALFSEVEIICRARGFFFVGGFTPPPPPQFFLESSLRRCGDFHEEAPLFSDPFRLPYLEADFPSIVLALQSVLHSQP